MIVVSVERSAGAGHPAFSSAGCSVLRQFISREPGVFTGRAVGPAAAGVRGPLTTQSPVQSSSLRETDAGGGVGDGSTIEGVVDGVVEPEPFSVAQTRFEFPVTESDPRRLLAFRMIAVERTEDD